MSRGYLVFPRLTAQPNGLLESRRGNDWHTQQWLLHQIKAIEFQSVNTTRYFDAALR